MISLLLGLRKSYSLSRRACAGIALRMIVKRVSYKDAYENYFAKVTRKNRFINQVIRCIFPMITLEHANALEVADSEEYLEPDVPKELKRMQRKYLGLRKLFAPFYSKEEREYYTRVEVSEVKLSDSKGNVRERKYIGDGRISMRNFLVDICRENGFKCPQWVKRYKSQRVNYFDRMKLIRSGDVEQNPGPKYYIQGVEIPFDPVEMMNVFIKNKRDQILLLRAPQRKLNYSVGIVFNQSCLSGDSEDCISIRLNDLIRMSSTIVPNDIFQENYDEFEFSKVERICVRVSGKCDGKVCLFPSIYELSKFNDQGDYQDILNNDEVNIAPGSISVYDAWRIVGDEKSYGFSYVNSRVSGTEDPLYLNFVCDGKYELRVDYIIRVRFFSRIPSTIDHLQKYYDESNSESEGVDEVDVDAETDTLDEVIDN